MAGQAASAAGAVAGKPRDRAEERIPGTRRQIAAAMTASAFSIPHVTEFLTVDATRLMELRDRLRVLPQAEGLKLTPLAVVARALCAAVRSFPLMNSSWDEAAERSWSRAGSTSASPPTPRPACSSPTSRTPTPSASSTCPASSPA